MQNMENVKKLNAFGKLQDNLMLHSLVSHEYESQPRDYGFDDVLGLDVRLCPIEIHLLAAINENHRVIETCSRIATSLTRALDAERQSSSGGTP